MTAPIPTPKTAPPAERVYLVSYPKIISLYPSVLVAFFAGILMQAYGDPIAPSRLPVVVTSVFLWVFAFNLIIVGFDFPRGASLTLLFVIMSIVLGAFLLFEYFPDLFPALSRFVKSFHPVANSTFFYLYTFAMVLIFLSILIKVQFDFWEIRPNELLHHHGFLSDLERYPAPNLRVSKEINDVFEYFLFGSGRLILQPSNEPRSIILENVPFIDRKEAQLTKMLSVLQVELRSEENT
ncbi:MAG: hypothetical protein U0903_12375 [Planctomycetales bacterium]